MIYAFEDCLLDSDRRELHRLGELVNIEPQVFDILEFLARNRGRVARARRLDPRDPLAQAHWTSISFAHFLANRYEDAISAADKALQELANYPPALRFKTAACGLLGRADEARACRDLLQSVNPDASVSVLKSYYGPLLRHNPQGLAQLVEGLRLSGLPEE